MDIVRALIKKHEGVRLSAYRDSLGNPTIGVGFLLSRADARQRLVEVGVACFLPIRLTLAQAEALLDLDIADAALDLATLLPGFASMSPNRQAALIDMRFNLGGTRMRLFTATLAQLRAGNFSAAADSMLHSLWATQVGHRAQEDADMVRNG